MTPATAAIPLLLAITVCYALVCAVSPFGACRKCRGFGRQIRTSRFTGRLKPGPICRRCRGHGRRLRAGRWLYNHTARLYRDQNTNDANTDAAALTPGRKPKP